MILASAFLNQVQAPQFAIKPIYLFYGEEPLYLRDCGDAIRQRLKNEGFIKGESFEVDAGFDWQALQMETQAGSLFADRQYLLVNMPKGSPGKEGGAFLQQFCQWQQENPEMVVLLFCEKLDSRQLKSKWVQAIEAAGMVVQTKTVPVEALPKWIMQRASFLGLQLDQEAASLLAERTEGNLLAADQELIKLSLRYPSGESNHVNGEVILQNVVDQAHYQLFALGTAILKGQRQASMQILQRLQQEGIEAPVVLWLLSRELRLLSELQFLSKQVPLAQAFKQCQVWQVNQSQYRQALQRQDYTAWQSYLAQALQIDLKIKGQQAVSGEQEIWSALNDLVIKMAS
ncbi:DNA polymerase III subunit delta [Thiomicrorhabdus xiamenensis]|uniref:DNA polymerase III subunit delta n=1 Tax=Thiomicrorhabdus xiamenensis TaxID=2739063 RepID=A0A7D4SHP3_9GAMM|nr:DNA polymerase III subunit delta [Thiomicrorhabdus xiamenensis]QKI88560.1 DNA polymerase III subunit delta [Thiomicrorhabdus xiamenensis]